FGLSKEYSIGYLDSIRKNKIASINNYIPDSTKKTKALKALFPNHEVRKQQLLSLRNITVDSTAQTAYIKLAGFSQGSIRQFYRNSFKAIKELHINNLVIDVRENGGGNIGLSTTLTKYVSAKPFHFADTVAAVRKNFYCSRYIHPAWLYSIIMTFTARKKNDERFHFNFLEHHVYRLKKNFHYSGNIYIVQGGFTFSAATGFVSHLKGQPNVTVVGEETGGGYYGNSAVHLPVIKLPTTKLRITLPVYRIVTDSTRIKNGRGILPDVFVGPSSNAIRQGIDAKMQKVRELIEAGKKE
ncbi:MAG: S41 family peptidase, partial [Parafilimonas sp.]